MPKLKTPFILGDVNANVPGDVFAYGRGKTPGSGAIASNRLSNTTPGALAQWLVRKRIKTKTAAIFVVQRDPFYDEVMGTVEYTVSSTGALKERRRK